MFGYRCNIVLTLTRQDRGKKPWMGANEVSWYVNSPAGTAIQLVTTIHVAVVQTTPSVFSLVFLGF
jgi:hypothetical protein